MNIQVPEPFDYSAQADTFFHTPELLAEIERIVDDQVSKIAHKDALTLIGTDEKDLVMYHHGFGTFLRNTYSLWGDSALTKRWREDESSHDIRNNCDYSIDHPDSVSMMLIRTIYHKILFDRSKPIQQP